MASFLATPVMVVLGALAVGSVTFHVEANERAVVTRGGAPRYLAKPGWHGKLPWVDGVNRYSVAVRQFTLPGLTARTADGEPLAATMTVHWQIPPEAVGYVHGNHTDPEALLRTMMADRFRLVAGRTPAADKAMLGLLVFWTTSAEVMRLYHLAITDVQISLE